MAGACNHNRWMHRGPGRCLAIGLGPAVVVLVLVFFFLGGRLEAEWPAYATFRQHLPGAAAAAAAAAAKGREKGRLSSFSFDVARAVHTGWMVEAPDSWSVARLALPGTHDTLTHRVYREELQCQNSGLETQLRAGVRYLDVRARVQLKRDATTDSSSSSSSTLAEPTSPAPSPLGIYHGSTYTGYELADVLTTVFAFLDAYPSELVVMRLKEEAAPIAGAPDDPAGTAPPNYNLYVNETMTTAAWQPDAAAWEQAPFLAALDQYRLRDPRTARGFAEHVFQFDGGSGRPRVPTVGELRGKVLLLQEFPYFPVPFDPAADRPAGNASWLGLPWQLSGGLLEVEDDFQIPDLARLARKWTAIRTNLQAAAARSVTSGSSSSPLFLSHLSATVGMTPIDAAAGPPNGSVMGMNDRTGRWLVAGDDASDGDVGSGRDGRVGRDDDGSTRSGDVTPVGIVIADFPGRRLIDAVIQRNNFSKAIV